MRSGASSHLCWRASFSTWMSVGRVGLFQLFTSPAALRRQALANSPWPRDGDSGAGNIWGRLNLWTRGEKVQVPGQAKFQRTEARIRDKEKEGD